MHDEPRAQTQTPDPGAAHVDAEGRRCAKKTPSARKIQQKSETWYAKISGNRVSLETTDEGKAWIRLRQLLREARLTAAGVTDGYTLHAETPWSAHVDAWVAVVRSGEAGEQHILTMASRLETLRVLAEWSRIRDITSSTAIVALGKIQSEQGKSAQTRNHYLSHLKQFCRWLVEDERLRS